MEQTYIIAFSQINQDELVNYLKSIGISKYWFYNMPNSVFINSEYSAKEISDKIAGKFGTEKRQIVVNITDYYGRLPKDHWKYFIKNN